MTTAYIVIAFLQLVSNTELQKRSGDGMIREEPVTSNPSVIAPNSTLDFQLYENGPKCRIVVKDGLNSMTCEQVKA